MTWHGQYGLIDSTIRPLVHEEFVLVVLPPQLEQVVVYMVDLDAVVLQHLVSDLSLSDQSPRGEDVLDALDFDVDQLPLGLVSQHVVQLETAYHWFLVEVVVFQNELF